MGPSRSTLWHWLPSFDARWSCRLLVLPHQSHIGSEFCNATHWRHVALLNTLPVHETNESPMDQRAQHHLQPVDSPPSNTFPVRFTCAPQLSNVLLRPDVPSLPITSSQINVLPFFMYSPQSLRRTFYFQCWCCWQQSHRDSVQFHLTSTPPSISMDRLWILNCLNSLHALKDQIHWFIIPNIPSMNFWIWLSMQSQFNSVHPPISQD